MRITKLVAASAVLVTLVLGACGNTVHSGSRSGQVLANGTLPLPSASPTAPATSGGQAGGTPQTPQAHPQAATSPAPGATSSPIPQYAPGTQPAPATATLSAACVSRGGLQTLTIKTVPGYSVTFDAQYSDGHDGQKYGGMGYGYASSSGTFGGTWTVSPSAPLGQVTVWVAVAHGQYSAFRQPTFTVAAAC